MTGVDEEGPVGNDVPVGAVVAMPDAEVRSQGEGQGVGRSVVRPERRVRRLVRRHEPKLIGIVSAVALTLLWELASSRQWLDPVFFSRPSAIWDSFWSGYVSEGDLYRHLWATVEMASKGFALAFVFGIAFGVLLGLSRRLRLVLEPVVMAANTTPTVALLPLLILWLGIGDRPKLVLIGFGGLFSILVNTQVGVEQTDRGLLEVARAFRASRFQTITKVVLPSAVPYVLAGVRLAVGRVLILTFVAELFLANVGLGYVINDAGARFESDRLFVGVFTLTFLGVVGTQLVRALERWKFDYAVDG